MLFNSYLFIFIFLPLTLVAYFRACAKSHRMGIYTLIGMSALFYACFDPSYILLIAASILVNYSIAYAMTRLPDTAAATRRMALTAGVAFNLGLLGYYKYTDFFLANVNTFFGASLPLQHIILPLGISFFTFQQIGYIVDVHNHSSRPPHISEYAAFVMFFPHLVAGPIVHNREIITQLQDASLKTFRWDNVYAGSILFCVGLFKKMAIADTFAAYVGPGFEASSPHFFLAWAAALSYTMQIYFDFSGYSDMAIGLARMFNITFPQNFNNPYRALDIQDFWQRWHMTLSRFLRQYLYIPLGGNRRGDLRTLANLFTTFLLGGIWHGASWCFVAWGALHGAGMVAHRLWKKTGLHLPKPLAWTATFLFVNLAWVLFRARTWDSALSMLKGMAGLNGVQLPASYAAVAKALPGVSLGGGPFVVDALVAAVALAALLEIALKDYGGLIERHMPFKLRPAAYGALFLLAIIGGNRISEFIYFQF